jgi:hypothetical protein
VEDGMMERIIGEKITYTKEEIIIGILVQCSLASEQLSQT